jgi:photosystem II stability/assembly factor-like uncharacterized protein
VAIHIERRSVDVTKRRTTGSSRRSLSARAGVRLGAGLVAAGLCAFGVRGMQAQGQPPAPAPPPPVHASEDSILKNFTWRSIGPANMGGRIDDIAVVESNPSIYYVGFATGGIWKTTNNGTTFTPIFDDQPYTSIGDIAIAPSNPDMVYAGTGEPNNRQSASFGGGVYKSTDAGKTWKFMGLKDTQSIARIVVHPKNPDIAYVAAIGHLFGPNPERGLYKTTDGGQTWTNTKFIDNDTGFTDVVMDPVNPNVLYAASYQRRRQPWGFNGGGPGSGIWKTTDAAKTWTKITGAGLPGDPIIGRIGLDLARSKPSTIYASIEVGASGGTGAGVNDDGTLVDPNAGRGGGGGGGGFGGGRGQTPPPPDPKKSGIWRSDDAGKTWRFLSNSMDRPMYYSQIRVDPSNPEIAYQGGAPFFKTTDGGKTWRQVQGLAHSDHHAIWIDPRNGDHLLVGNDGGLDVSYDQAATWEFVNSLGAVGQFYKVSADMRKPYMVCGGLQDNGSWCGPSAVRSTNGILNSDWYRVGGGDGFYTANDPSDWRILYSESQDGATQRLDLGRGTTVSIRPRGPSGRGGPQAAAGGESPDPAVLAQFGFGPGAASGNIVPPPPAGTNFRFYWNTPFLLSPHNPSTIYLGGERLFKSMDRGNTWVMSDDLTRKVGRNDRPIMGVDGKAPMASKHDGAAAYSNIVTISESPVVPGIVWAGTNDGNVQVSRDGGQTWKNVVDKVPGVPKETHVSRVEASPFDAGGAYVTFDGHRTDDHKPYVFVTKDFGETWSSIASNLPPGNVNVITADSRNRDLLFLGTEYAIFVSMNGGREWKPLMQGMPTVRVDDLIIHPRDRDLIAGTHGRSIWILDDISPLEAMSETTQSDAYLFEVRPATAWLNDIQKQITVGGAKNFRGQNPDPGTAINYWLKGNANSVRVSISDITGREIRVYDAPKSAGLNRVRWDLRAGPPQGRGAGTGQAEQPAATAPATQPAAPNPPANPPAAGRQGGGREDVPAVAPAQGRGAAPAAGQPAAAAQAAEQGRGGGGGGGRGRGGFGGPPLAPGTYLVKVTVDGKVIGTKTVTVEADSLQ